MNKNAQLWVDALRSDAYQQGEGALRVGTPDDEKPSLCCLGVACELYRLNTGKGEWQYIGCVDDGDDNWKFMDESGVLPAQVKHWLGLADDEGTFLPSGGELELGLVSLLESNDEGMPFAEIANLIEKKENELFSGVYSGGINERKRTKMG